MTDAVLVNVVVAVAVWLLDADFVGVEDDVEVGVVVWVWVRVLDTVEDSVGKREVVAVLLRLDDAVADADEEADLVGLVVAVLVAVLVCVNGALLDAVVVAVEVAVVVLQALHVTGQSAATSLPKNAPLQPFDSTVALHDLSSWCPLHIAMTVTERVEVWVVEPEVVAVLL